MSYWHLEIRGSKAVWQSIQSGFSTVFGVDTRSLALFRIVIGCVLLADLATRAPFIEVFYTDAGSFSREMCESVMKGGYWSLHLYSGSEQFQQLMFAIAAGAAVCMIFGCFTRTATFLSWLLLISLHVRNPLLLNSGDTLLRTTLFWSLFLPLGKQASIDAWWKAKRLAKRGLDASHDQVKWWFSGATAGIILQLFVMYWFTGLAKLNSEWLNGVSLEYVLRMDMFIYPFGKWLLNFPDLLNFLSRSTLWLELLGPTLLLLPWMNRYLRLLMLGAFFSLHLGIMFSISVGLFSAISMTCWLPLIPSMVWDSKWVQATFRSLRGITEQGVETKAESMATQKFHFGSYALGGFSFLVLVFILGWNVQNMERLPKSKNKLARKSHEFVNAVMLTPLDGSKQSPENPCCIAFFGRVTMLAQEYEMFGPVPRHNHWFVYRARLEDGTLVDVRTGAEATDDRPEQMMLTLPDHRWRKLHRNLMLPNFESFRQPMADYFCRKWNQEHDPGNQITRLEFVSYVEEISPTMRHGDYEEVILATIKLAEDPGDEIVDLLDELENSGGLLPY